MKYFLTGATGFLGGELARQLLDGGHEVVALVRDRERAAALADAGAELAVGDVTEKESMRAATTGADGVFHLAAWYEVGTDGAAAERVNVDGTRNVLELVAECSVPKAVYTSTLAVNSDTRGQVVDESYRYYGPHLSTYDRTKWAAHYEVAVPMAEAGLPLVVVVPGVVYGPGDRGPTWTLWERYLDGDLPVVPRRTAYCWGHVADVARAHRQAMERGVPGETYVVAGEPYTLVEAMALAERATGVPAPRAVSPAWFRVASVLAGLAGRLPAVDLPPEYRAESLRVLAGVTYLGDNAKARRDLGLDHRPFEEGLAATLAHELDARRA